MIRDFCKKLVRYALCNGLDRIEAYGVQTVINDVKVFQKEIEECQLTEICGVYVRGEFEGGIGEVYTEQLEEEAFYEIVKQIKHASCHLKRKEGLLLYPPGSIYAVAQTGTSELEELKNIDIVNLALKLEKIVLETDASVRHCDNCSVIISSETVVMENSLGLSLYSKENIGLATCGVTIQEGDNLVSSFDVMGFKSITEFNEKEFGINIIHKAKRKCGALSFGSEACEMNVIFEHSVMAELLGGFQSIFSAEQTQLGISPLAGKEGTKICSSLVSIVDNPFHGYGSRVFDGEGVPTRKVDLIIEGKLECLMQNLKTADKAKVEPTGNAFRGEEGQLGIGSNGLCICSGENTFDELLEIMEKGIIVTEINDKSAGINVISGDFSLACEGILVKEGKMNGAVTEMTVSGNFLEMLKDIIAVGNDFHYNLLEGVFGSPSVYVGKLNVVGEN